MKVSIKKVLVSIFLLIVGLEGRQLFSEDTLFTSSLANLVFKDNFHEVVPNKFYRSAQVKPERFRKLVTSYNIKTVLDVRFGIRGEDSPYSGEEVRAKKLGVDYIHFPLKGSEMPSNARLKELLDLFDRAKTPLLVHCTSGSHRSGVVAAIWLLHKENKHINEAKNQLSPKYGFFWLERKLKSFFEGSPTIDQVIWTFDEDTAESNVSFRDWLT